MNPDDFLYEYAVVRYVPRVDREEFVNIGMIMMCKRRRWLKGKLKFNEARLEAFDPYLNMESLFRQASIFTRKDVPAADIPIEEKYRWLTAVKSSILQVSPSHPGYLPLCSYEEPLSVLEAEFNRLFKSLVE